MSGIEDMQTRLAQALDRIGQAAEAWDPSALIEARAALEAAEAAAAAPAPVPEVDIEAHAALQAELEDERLANAQLEERIRQLNERLEASQGDAALAERMEAQRDGIVALETELQRLRRTNDMLARTSDALRSANADGLADAELINKAMLAELESLRAARAVDAAEAKLVLDTLAPLAGSRTEAG
jgi:predicted RNase H-like nuclease (RuvC/YqgF family)